MNPPSIRPSTGMNSFNFMKDLDPGTINSKKTNQEENIFTS